MSQDERDYMHDREGHDKPAQNNFNSRNHESNAVFWKSVQNGNRSSWSSWPLIVSVALGLYIGLFMYQNNVDLKTAVTYNYQMLVKKVKDIGITKYALAPAVCNDAIPVSSFIYLPTEIQKSSNKEYLEFKNYLPHPIFLKINNALTGVLSQEIFITSGDVVVANALSPESSVEVQEGSVWCQNPLGWINPSITNIGGNVKAIKGISHVIFASTNNPSGFGVNIAYEPEKPATQTVANNNQSNLPIAYDGYQFGVPVTYNGAIQPQNSPGVAPVESDTNRKVVIQPYRAQSNANQAALNARAAEAEMRRRQEVEMERQRQMARANAYANANANANANSNSNSSVRYIPQGPAIPEGVRIQDWRDVPQRDIRIVTNGRMHYVNGRVGDEDVQFEIGGHLLTVIGEGMANRAGASQCVNGDWLVFGRYWAHCKRLISNFEFGSVRLENVLVVVVPGERTPVLGNDLMGNSRIFNGRDGDYLSVGN